MDPFHIRSPATNERSSQPFPNQPSDETNEHIEATRLKERARAKEALAVGVHGDTSYLIPFVAQKHFEAAQKEYKESLTTNAAAGPAGPSWAASAISDEQVQEVRARLQQKRMKTDLFKLANEILHVPRNPMDRVCTGRKLHAELDRIMKSAREHGESTESYELADMIATYQASILDTGDVTVALRKVVGKGGTTHKVFVGSESISLNEVTFQDFNGFASTLLAQVISHIDKANTGFIPVDQIIICCQVLGPTEDVGQRALAACTSQGEVCKQVHVGDLADVLAVACFQHMSVADFLVAMRRLVHWSTEVLTFHATMPAASMLKSSEARKDLAELWTLAPGRALQVETNVAFLSKSLELSAVQGELQARRKGFEMDSAEVDSYRQPDLFGLDDPVMREPLLQEVWDQPVSLRRKQDLVRELPLKSNTKVDLLHELRESDIAAHHQAAREAEFETKALRKLALSQQKAAIEGEGGLLDHIQKEAAEKAASRAAKLKSSRFAPVQVVSKEKMYVRGGQFYIP